MNGAPVFVKIDDYKQVVEIIGMIKKNINEAKQTLRDISALKEKEENDMHNWSTDLETIEAKVNELDRSLSEPSQEW